MPFDLAPVGLWTYHLDRLPVPHAQEVVAELDALAGKVREASGRLTEHIELV